MAIIHSIPILEISLVAIWSNESFLAMPAYWHKDGRIEVRSDDWKDQSPPPKFRRNGNMVKSVMGHLRNESAEFPVSYTEQENGDVLFRADRSVLPATSTLAAREKAMQMLDPNDASTVTLNEIEVLLVGTLKYVHDAIHDKGRANLVKSVEELHGVFRTVKSHFPRALALQMRDGSKIAIPALVTDPLADTVAYVFNRTAPQNVSGQSAHYSARLALVAVYQQLMKSMDFYKKDFAYLRAELLKQDPKLQAVYPEGVAEVQGELQKGMEPWPGLHLIREGLSHLSTTAQRTIDNRKVVEYSLT